MKGYPTLDLSGKVAYTMGTTSSGQYLGKLWSVNTSNHTIAQTNVAVNTELTKEARLWYFTGNDPYEVTIKNPAYSATAVLAGKEPAPSAAWNTVPNNKYPLVQMVEPNDGTYKLNTFMVLKYNPKEVTTKIGNVEHSAGTLKLYITGNDRQYLAESNSLAGGVYVYTDELPYKQRLKAEGEPFNPKNDPPTMIIYSSFFYRPVLTYHIITNAKKEALTGYSLMAGTTVEMPEMYQSPLLNSGDFKYYTTATEDAGTWNVDTSSETAATTAIADVVAKNQGDIYVRYAYGASPFKIATNIDDDADVQYYKKEEAQKEWREFINKYFDIPCTIIANWNVGIYDLKENTKSYVTESFDSSVDDYCWTADSNTLYFIGYERYFMVFIGCSI